LILLDKPAGLTSFSALRGLKHALKTGKIGHTGTLDKFATGLLVVLIGRYTKLADLFSGLDKRYRATVVFGRTTDTLDTEGEVCGEGPLPELPNIEEAANRLTGRIEQLPPAYSALHVGGQRAYRVARRGGEPQLQPRTITVYRIEILDYRAPQLDIVVECSKGTYVRALARDIGALCGSCAYLNALRRTGVGPYSVEEAVPADVLAEPGCLAGSVARLSRLPGLGTVAVKEDAVTGVRNGRKLGNSLFTAEPKTDGLYTVLDPAGNLLAVAVRKRGEYRYKMVL
jgi:tRNA pseudouridine55 synthase